MGQCFDAATRALIERLVVRLDGGHPPEDWPHDLGSVPRDKLDRACHHALALDRLLKPAPGRSRTISEDPAPGTRFGGFRLLERIGSGGMGTVFRAVQEDLEREVALKLIRSEGPVPRDRLLRFQHEAKCVGALDHPGIVRVFFAGEQDGCAYYAMELVRGPTLRHELNLLLAGLRPASCDQGGLLPRSASGYFHRVARILAEICAAVVHAHVNGVIHRDLKPENILLASDGRPRLVDFGLAIDPDSTRLTWSGDLLGTPAYLAPEVIQGASATESSDVWALGVIAYELVTLSRPFGGDSVGAVLDAIKSRPVPRAKAIAADCPLDIERICAKALEKDPRARYARAAALEDDLRRFLSGEPVAPHVASWPVRVRWHMQRRAGWYAATCASIFLILLAVGITSGRARRALAAEALKPFRTSLATHALATSPPEELSAGYLRAEELEESEDHSVEDRRVLAEYQTRVREEQARRLETQARELSEAAGSPIGTASATSRPRDEGRVLDVLGRVFSTLSIARRPDEWSPEEVIFPTLTVSVTDPPSALAHVRVVDLDPLDGLPRSVVIDEMAAPIVRCPLPPGYYRIMAVIPGTGHAEADRHLQSVGEHVVKMKIVADAVASTRMVTIPAGEALVGQEGAKGLYGERSVFIPAFSIDVTEVTCAEYLRFVREFPGDRELWPKTWGRSPADYRHAWDALPVVGIGWPAARRYAEWAGKRLLGWAEWQVAARGRDGATVPPGYNPNHAGITVAIDRGRVPWDQGVNAAGTSVGDVSPFGVLDLYANVPEWTGTPFVAEVELQLYPMWGWRIAAGAGWKTSRFGLNQTLTSLARPSSNPPEITDIGFRCGKSLNL